MSEKNNFTTERIELLLSLGKEELLSQVPISADGGPLNMHNYRKLKKENPDWYHILVFLAQKLQCSKKRARKMSFEFDLTLTHLAEVWIEQKGLCVLTGLPMQYQSGSHEQKNSMACSIDRIYNEYGYVKGNIALTTHWANNSKHTYSYDEFRTMISAAYKKLSEPHQLTLF